ncbi:dihydropyrimidinase isoform X2 [Plutella xylostella]|uniref:dihydropyrimidinase isoform X2 n=1 Tax=Plutella xylostella TaxID=51655 RepID=UPI0020330633|nr:dihydropyrimidinase isoform X2 [Plutella xylostella]
MATSAPVKKVPIHLQSSQNRLLIKNGKIVNDDGMEDGDVYIEDGVIKQVGRNLIIPGGTRVIDASGKLVMPGGVDPHTHLELEMMGAKTADDFYKGTRAAVAGGTTTVIDFVLPNKGQSLIEAYNNWREKADSKVCCDYALHVGVTWWSSSVKKDMEQLAAEMGVNSFKMFMAYRDSWMLDDYELMCAMEACKEIQALPQVHAENGHIIARNTQRLLARGVTAPEGHLLSRDEEVEAEAVNRACVIANQVNTPLYIVHMMSKSAVRALQEARRRGQKNPVFGETLAATVGTDGSHCRNACFRHAAAHVLSPPLRADPHTPEAIVEALADDVLQVIGSDNCTFHEKDKELGKDDFSKIPNGVNGVEDRLAVLWQKAVNTGVMDPCRFVAVTSSTAAKIFNMWPQKGRVAVNSDADVVVWDPRLERTISAATHKQAVDFNIFEGQKVVGSPQYVIVNGRVCLDDGVLRVAEGSGRFIKTPANSPYVFGGQLPGAAAPEAHLTIETPTKYTNGNTPSPGRYDQDYVLADLTLVNKHLEGMALASGMSTPTGRKMREPGQRDQQKSSFSISKEVEGPETKTSVRVRNPPGGKSSGLW